MGKTLRRVPTLFLWLILLPTSLLVSCSFEKEPLGTRENPIKLFFVPSVEAKSLADRSQIIKSILEKLTPYHFEVRIPESYIAVVEAFGAKRVDIAALNTFGYILAHEKFKAEALLTVIRHGHSTYQSQILVRSDSKIKKLEDLKGKTMAYVDPASTSGYLFPRKELKDRNIQTGKHVFAMSHDAVVSMVYKGRVDAGATFHTPPQGGEIQDARRLVKTQYPNIEREVKILHLTKGIPNEPIVFRKDIPPKMKTQLVEAFLKLVKTPQGKRAVSELSSITELKLSSDADYKYVREMIQSLGTSAMHLIKGGKKPTKKAP